MNRKIMIFVVGFMWLVLGPTSTLAIQISPEAGLRNATSPIMITSDDVVIPIPITLTANRTLGTEISTSERQRRLIPYMAFYLPPTEFPINQQYLVQVPSKQQLQHQSPQKSQKQQHSIPLPTAYVHMKVPINNQQSHHSSQNHHQAAAFQTIAYGGQHPFTQLKENNKVAIKIPTPPPPQHSILPPNGATAAPQRVPIRNVSKHKSVGGQQQYHQPEQQQPASAVHSQNFNLTPFTPTNTVPGHFIPIIYTNEQQANSVNYKPTAPSSTSMDSRQQQRQYQQLHQYNEVPNIVQLKEHQLLQHPSHSSVGHKQQSPEDYYHQRPHGELAAARPVASPVPSAELVVPKTLSQIQQQERKHVQYVAQQPTAGPPSSSNLRIVSDLPGENRHQYQQQQPFSNTENLTPQQKYVLYLRQQLRYKQQQQLQEHQKEHVQQEQHLQQQPPPSHHHQQQQQQQRQQQQQYHQSQQTEQQHNRQYPQPEHVYVVSTTASPPVLSSTVGPPTQSIDVHHGNHHNLNRFNEKYPQHSPISHVVHQQPEVITNPEQIFHPRKQQQPSYPLAHRPEAHRYAQHQLQPHQQYQSNPNYIEYVIDDPKQEIEEQSPEKGQHQSIRPPPILLVKNAVPPPPPVEVVVTSPRPMYKNQPTLRLHAISPTPRPTVRPYTQSSYNPTPTAPMVLVSSKPKYSQLFPTASPTPVKLQPSQKYAVDGPDEDPLPDIKTSSLAEILRKLQESNHLPQTLTPDNIDNSIRTLIKILHNLKGSQTIVDNPSQHHDEDYDYNSNNNAGIEEEAAPAQQDLSAPMPSAKPGPNSGRPGIDYPTLASIPVTSFSCQEQRYKGFFGDPETNCQVWHYCDLNGGKASFLCPNGTIFSQVGNVLAGYASVAVDVIQIVAPLEAACADEHIALTCDWWFNVKCATTPQLYVLNERLYKYILPFTPKFPEDYSGPLVDKYLALKFKEMEEKMRREKLKGRAGGDGGVGETGDSVDDGVTEKETSSEDGSTEAFKNKKVSSSGSSSSSLSPIGEQSSEKNLLIDEENGRIRNTHSSTLATTKELPLSLQPIVVSTTASPFAKHSSDDDDGEADRSMGGDKVSVEKVEVIEIKSDGTSGHLIPGNRYSSADT